MTRIDVRQIFFRGTAVARAEVNVAWEEFMRAHASVNAAPEYRGQSAGLVGAAALMPPDLQQGEPS